MIKEIIRNVGSWGLATHEDVSKCSPEYRDLFTGRNAFGISGTDEAKARELLIATRALAMVIGASYLLVVANSYMEKVMRVRVLRGNGQNAAQVAHDAEIQNQNCFQKIGLVAGPICIFIYILLTPKVLCIQN